MKIGGSMMLWRDKTRGEMMLERGDNWREGMNMNIIKT